jgi:hypothetical protein
MGFGLFVAMAGALIAAGPTPVMPIGVQTAPREAFDRGRTAFERAEYKRAIEILSPLLYPELLLESEGEQVAAHRMLSIAYLFENREDDARREFKKLLALRPEFRFEPLLDSQRVVTFFEEFLRQEKAYVADLERLRQERIKAREEEKRRIASMNLTPTVLRYERHSFAVALIPFGAGQFQNGERRKGWWFFGVESALAAVSLGAFVTNFALYGASPERGCTMETQGGVSCPPGFIDESQEDTSRLLLRVQVASGLAFWAVAVWGVVDAVRNFKPEVPLNGNGNGNGNGTTNGNGARAASPAPFESFRLSFSPAGLGAAWAF